MSDQIIDMTKLARQAVRASRQECEHRWSPHGKGVERCTLCGDQFPCRGRCEHIDCIERAYEIGLRSGFPRDFSYSFASIADKHTYYIDECPGCSVAPEAHYAYDVDVDTDPETWITLIPLEAK